MKQVYVSGVAENDLRQAWYFVAEGSIEAADRQETAFREAFAKLAEMPMMGEKKSEWTDRPVRFWSAGSYWVVYRPDTDPLEIVRVLHAARDIPGLL
jgi:toxin ParE1/3/4